MKATLTQIPRAALNLVFPAYCYGCKTTLKYDNDHFICQNCFNKLTSRPVMANLPSDRHPHIKKIYHCCLYEGLAKELIHKFKYEKKYFLRHVLTDLLYDFFIHNITDQKIDTVIAVPIHIVDEKRRGFNQSETLAKGLAEKTGLPFLAKALIKSKKTKAQAKLKKSQRLDNLKNTFTLRQGLSLENKCVLLIDDVYTTGATINECARALAENNVRSVITLTFSKGI
jgi:competence protein ComFC